MLIWSQQVRGAIRTGVRRALEVVGVLAVVVVVVVGVRRLAQQAPPERDGNEDLSLEAQWNKTIRRLGIEPVFPPEEDLAVGDLFAAVFENDQRDLNIEGGATLSTPFLRKSVKLAHIDVRDDLEAAYAELPVFPESVPASLGRTQRSDAVGGPPSGLPAAAPGLFRPGAQRKGLPMAAFPGLTISHGGSAAAGISGGLRGFFNFGSSREDSEKLVLPSVETYGLPSIRAGALLYAYCHAAATRNVCSEETARTHLRPLVGEGVLAQYLDNNTGEFKYGVTIRIFMVSRVYLVRAILHQQQAGAAEGGGARVTISSAGANSDITAGRVAPLQPTSAAGEAAPDATPREAALQKRIDEIEKQLATLQTSAAVAYRSQFGREILLDQTFLRPVAIGYRHVLHEFETAEKSD